MIKQINITLLVMASLFVIPIKLVAQLKLVSFADVRVATSVSTDPDKNSGLQMAIVVKSIIVNEAQKDYVVATGISPSGSGAVVGYSYTRREVNGYWVKPPATSLALVTLKPGEAAELEEWVFPIPSLDYLPKKIRVFYDSKELSDFALCWIGELETECIMDIPQIKKRLGEK